MINMDHIRCQFAGDDPAVQREAVDLLARCFEVWAERKVAFTLLYPTYSSVRKVLLSL